MKKKVIVRYFNDGGFHKASRVVELEEGDVVEDIIRKEIERLGLNRKSLVFVEDAGDGKRPYITPRIYKAKEESV